VGYQAEGTLGRILINGAKAVKLFNEWINVAAQIDVLQGVSGHADKMGLIAWLKGFEKKPALIFVNHGDPEAADSFTDCLNQELGYQAVAPYSGSRFDLLRGEFEFVAEPRPIEGDGRKASSTKSARLFAELVAAAERLLQICQTMKGRPNKDLSRFTKELEKLSNAMER
jgi:metallo-beta-lactamase family protein